METNASSLSSISTRKTGHRQDRKTISCLNSFETLFNKSSFPKIIFNAGGYDFIAVNDAALRL
jgi:hypothetical protein